MKISWLLLTYNRANSALRAIPYCMKNAGREWHELVWVDNGSCPADRKDIEIMLSYQSAKHGFDLTQVLLPKNLGVAKGYNRTMALATGTHAVITGMDMLMPDNWLANMARCFEQTPETGVVTIYAKPIDETPERIRGPVYEAHGMRLQPAMPIGRRMLSVELLREIGYFPECFGMYGYDDIPWGHRAEKVCQEKGLLFYNLVDSVAEHLGTEGNVGYDFKDEHEYWRWKKEQVQAQYKQKLLVEIQKMGFPKFSPFCNCGAKL